MMVLCGTQARENVAGVVRVRMSGSTVSKVHHSLGAMEDLLARLVTETAVL